MGVTDFENKNLGVFTVSAGKTVTLTYGTAGKFDNQTGATLTINGTFDTGTRTLASTGTINGSGTLKVSNGTLQLNSNHTLGNLTVQVGDGVNAGAWTTTNASTVTTAGGVTFVNGTLALGVTLTAGTFLVENHTNAPTITSAGSLNINSGATLMIRDTTDNDTSYAELNSAGVITVASGGFITMDSTNGSAGNNDHVWLDMINSGLGKLVNHGTMTTSGSGITIVYLSGEVENDGSITVGHTTHLDMGVTDFENKNLGTFTVSPGKSVFLTYGTAGKFDNQTGATLTINGTFDTGTRTITSTGTINGSGTLIINSGSLITNSAHNFGSLTVQVGSGANAGDWSTTNSSTATTGGTVNFVKGTIGLGVTLTAGTFLVQNHNNAPTITSSGALNINSGATLLIVDTVDDDTSTTELNSAGVITIASGGTFTLDVTNGTGGVNDHAALDMIGSGLGKLVNHGAMTVSGSGLAHATVSGEVDNHGTISVNHTYSFFNIGGTDFENKSGGVFTVTSAKTATFSGTSTSKLDNQTGATITVNGTLDMGGRGVTSTGTINGTGTLVMNGGALVMNSNHSLPSTLTVQIGAGANAASWSTTNASTATSSGTINAVRGTIELPVVMTAGTFKLDNTAGAPTITSTGSLTIGSGATLLIRDLLDDDTSTTELNSAGIITINAGGFLTLDSTNGSGGANDDVALDMIGSGLGKLINHGTMTLSGNGVTVIKLSGEVDNDSTIDVNHNTTFTLGNTDFDNLSGGVFTIASGKTLTIAAGGTGIFNVFSGSTLNVTGSLNLNGHDIFIGGTVNGIGNITLGGGLYIYGTAQNAAGVTVSSGQTAAWGTGGVMSGSGTYTIADGGTLRAHGNHSIVSGLTLTLGTSGAGATWSQVGGPHTVTVSGIVDLKAGTIAPSLTAASGGTVQLANTNDLGTIAGAVTVNSGGFFTVEDTTDNNDRTELNVTGAIANAGTLTLNANGGGGASNDGAILDMTGGGSLSNTNIVTFSGTNGNLVTLKGGNVTNSGTINVNQVTSFESGTLTSTGSIAIAAGKTLTIASGASLVQGLAGTGTYTGSGTLNISVGASFHLVGNATVNFAVTNTGSINVDSSRTLTMASGATLTSGASGAFTGAGTIHITDGATLQSTANGSIGSGLTLSLGSTAGAGANWTQSGGPHTVTISGMLDPKRAVIAPNLSIASGGTLRVSETGWDAVALTGDVTILSGGTFLLEETNITDPTDVDIYGTITNYGSFVFVSNLNTVILDMTNGVKLINQVGGTITNSASNSSDIIGEIDNYGSITLSNQTNIFLQSKTSDNFSGASFTVTGSVTELVGGGTFNNEGLISLTGGTLEVKPNANLVLKSGGTYTGTGGTLFLDDSSTLRLEANATLPFAVNMGTTGGAGAAVTQTGGPFTLTFSGAATLNRGTIAPNVIVGTGGSIALTNHLVANAVTIGGSLTINTGRSVTLTDSIGDGVQTELNVTGGIANSGTITMVNSGGTDATVLDAAGATITNNSGANITILLGNSIGGHEIRGDVVNAGTITVGRNTNFVGGTNGLSNTSTINVNATTYLAGNGTGANSGSIVIASGKTFELSNGYTLQHNSGGTYTGAGTFHMYDGATFRLTANATIASGFAFGTVGGAGASVTQTGGPWTLTFSGAADLNRGTIAPHVVVSSTGSMVVEEANAGVLTIAGNLQIDDGGTLLIRDNLANAQVSQLNVSGILRNYGDITLDNSGPGNNVPVLDIGSSGKLINEATGTVTLAAPYTAAINREIDNYGLIIFTQGGGLNLHSFDFENYSGGQFTVNVGVTATIDDDGNNARTFWNLAGATMTINGALQMQGTDLNNAGTINGTGTISMGSNGGNAGTFTNTGSSTITPGASPGRLVIDGNAVFGASTRTVIELGGRAANQNDFLGITHRFVAGGTLAIAPWLAFAAAAGDQFDVMAWDERIRMFDEADGLDVFSGLALDTQFSDHGLTLVAKTITADGTDGNDSLLGASGDDVIVGRDGNDVLDGGIGSDVLLGGAGYNRFFGGEGDDRLIGGIDEDTADYSRDAGSIRVDLNLGTATDGAGDTDTLISIERLMGSDYADIIIGSDEDNILTGGLGADTMTGGAGRDTFVLRNAGEGGDTITDFTSGEDTIFLDGNYGFSQDFIQQGVNFSVVDTFGGNTAGENAAYASGEAALIFAMSNNTLYYDPNGAQAGYSVLASIPGVVLGAGDIQLVAAA
jgi:hypothetical protein